MKKITCLMMLAGGFMFSCSSSSDDSTPTQKGELTISATVDSQTDSKTLARMSSNSVDDFQVSILKGDQVVHSYDKFSEVPETVELEAGEYSVNAVSKEFTAPAFASPVYGDMEKVSVTAENTAQAELVCVQTNAGVKLVYTDAFKAKYSTYSAELSSEIGKLDYVQDEARTGYFLPGDVKMKINLPEDKSVEKTVAVAGKELWTVTVDYTEEGEKTGISISITIDDSVDQKETTIIVRPGEGEEPGDGETPEPGEGDGEIFISEYGEGSSQNKAIELYNPTGADMSLEGYALAIFANGATDEAANVIPLSGTIKSGGVFLITHLEYNKDLLNDGVVADQTSDKLTFNGDDVVFLLKNDTRIDVFGTLGNEKNNKIWGDKTFIRKASVKSPSTTFNEDADWDKIETRDDGSNLGSHTVN
ncbi:hypothetical protein FUAX_09380 [Fulvitalea axinellae]|uniref:LTD domain-containing protein n=1 Tax=Fulvitalea axinellae TaxID=1182444 RepID=A0AAU9CI20_9BACT|nr:hypothetical protein FUAX_09380 [Fulvitalea axinellae]